MPKAGVLCAGSLRRNLGVDAVIANRLSQTQSALMSIAFQNSLFEPAPQPVMVNSAQWIGDVMFGQVALGLCVLAVAFLGTLMLTGRMPIRDGFRVVLGCFVLLGAPVIAAGFMQNENPATAPVAAVIEPEHSVPRADLPPARYNPYAQASVRDDK